MFKKFTITLLISVTLFNLGLLFQPGVYAAPATSPNDIKSSEFTFPLEDVLAPPGMKSGDVGNWMKKGIDFFFERGITIMAGTIGTAAVLMMVIGGFLILSSAGNDTRINKGKAMIKNSLIGLAAVLGAYILVTTVQLLIKSIFQ